MQVRQKGKKNMPGSGRIKIRSAQPPEEKNGQHFLSFLW